MMSTEIVRFTTAGSVDDGKSTLIGRLLYDSKAIFDDTLAAVQETTTLRGEEGLNLALLTDGLRAEREQGITIDVAYRYFSTPKRKFIIADTPGHIQYTRNMVTGASTANVALLLVDARVGLVEQSKRHAIIASLLQIPHVVVCINKMDLVGYDATIFQNIVEAFSAFAAKLEIKDITFIPISALLGDNVVNRSEAMSWYEGQTLMYYLEHVHIASDYNYIDPRFPVQMVIRPNTDAFHDYRGYAGMIAGGTFRKGERVTVLPSGFSTTIVKIDSFDGELLEAAPPQSVTFLLDDDLDISRGNMIVKENNQPQVSQEIELSICWFDATKPLQLKGKYALKHTTMDTRCIIQEIRYRLDIQTLHRDLTFEAIQVNDIARVVIKTMQPIMVDSYNRNRTTGSIVLIDEQTNQTVAAGMIVF